MGNRTEPGKEGGEYGSCSNEERAESPPSVMPPVTPAADVLTSAREGFATEGMVQCTQERHFAKPRRKGAVQIQGAAAAAAARERLKSTVPGPSAPSEPLLFRVLYSLHSCFAELDAFVRLVRPSVIRPIAGKDPYGLDTCPNAHFGELRKRWGRERGSQEPHSILAEGSANPGCDKGFDRGSGGPELSEGEEHALELRVKRGRKWSALPKVRRVVIRRKRLRVCSISPSKADASAAPGLAESAKPIEATGPPVWKIGGLTPGGLDASDSGVNTLKVEQSLPSGGAEQRSSGLQFDVRVRVGADAARGCVESNVRLKVKQEETGGGVDVQVSSLGGNPQHSETHIDSNERCLSTEEAIGLASMLPDWYMEAHNRWVGGAVLADTCCKSAAAADDCEKDQEVGEVQTGQPEELRSFKRTLPRFVQRAGQNLRG